MIKRKKQEQDIKEVVHNLATEYLQGYVTQYAEQIAKLQHKVESFSHDELAVRMDEFKAMVADIRADFVELGKEFAEVQAIVTNVQGDSSIGELEHRVQDLETKAGW